MPIVASSAAEYELKRQLMLQEYDAQSNIRNMILKSKQHLKDTGSTLYQPSQKRSSLESLIDSQKIDENLKKKLVNDLNSDVGVAQSFIQSLDESLKQLLFNRFPLFKEIFEDNFSVATSQNLRGAFNLFQNEIIAEDKSVETPSIESVEKYLGLLKQNRLEKLQEIIFVKGLNRQGLNQMPKTVENVKKIIQTYLKRYNNDLEGYMSLYSMLKMNGFDDIPKPKIGKLNQVFTINNASELTPDVTDAAAEPVVQATNLEDDIETKYNLKEMNKLISNYNKSLKSLPTDQKGRLPKINNYSSLNKPQLAKILANDLLFNPRTGKYNIFDVVDIADADPIESDDDGLPAEEFKGEGIFNGYGVYKKHKHLIKKHVPGYVRIY